MAAKGKVRKRSNLRHAEYYDFQQIQDELYASSLQGREFKNLVTIIASPENIKLAYRNIKKNHGSMTSGTDGKNIKDLEKLTDEELTTNIQRKFDWYVPQSIRRVEIPKGNGKLRPLGIPTITDRLIQQCILQVLEPICEAKFHEHSYGFRPNRNQSHAIAEVDRKMQLHGLHYVVDIDIKGFFDNVSHGKLLKQLWTLGIRDKKLLSILSTMLKAEVAGIGFPKAGVPQGGIISPLLSNVVLNEFDWWIASQWEEIPTRHAYTRYQKPNGVWDHGSKFRFLRQTNLKECWSVRFADDFKIFARNYQDAVKLFHATKGWLKDRLGLDISPEKSKIVNLKESYSEFLGFKMRVIKRGKKKNGQPKYVVESHIRDKSQERIIRNLQKLIYDMEHPKSGCEYATLSRYNSFVLGIHNYYSIATRISEDCSKLAFRIQSSLKSRLGDRLKTVRQMEKRKKSCKIPLYIQERYGLSRQLRFVDGCALIPLGYAQHRVATSRKRSINAYTPEGRKEIHKQLRNVDMSTMHYLMRNPIQNQSVEYNDNRLSLFAGQSGKCAITGELLTPYNIHCHHKVPRYMGGKDNYQNLVLVTDNVHRLIHAKNADTIRRYLDLLRLNSKQLKKLNQLRNLANVESCLNI